MAGRAPSRPAVAGKRAFDVDEALGRIEESVRPLPKAAMFELAEDGHRSVFEQLVACVISIRTRDEVMVAAARRLFERARTPSHLLRLSEAEIDRLIHPATFHERKAAQLREIARVAEEEHGGSLPCSAEALLALKGVGPKCTNLALGIACGAAGIGVDVHVHRVTNRWGYVEEPTPEKTMAALEKKLPRRHWLDINRLLVPFGKHVCTGRLPHCTTCPVLEMCRQVGVEAHR